MAAKVAAPEAEFQERRFRFFGKAAQTEVRGTSIPISADTQKCAKSRRTAHSLIADIALCARRRVQRGSGGPKFFGGSPRGYCLPLPPFQKATF